MGNRKRVARGRVTRLRLDDYGINDLFSFMLGWRPPIGAFEISRATWQSWQEYFDAYDAVKDELLADQEIMSAYPDVRIPFADAVRAELAAHPGQQFDAHGHAALRHEHFYRKGDGHKHSFAPAGYAAVEARG